MSLTRRAALAALGVAAVSPRILFAAPRPDLYACEGCDAALERAPVALSEMAVLADDDEPGERLVLMGTVYAAAGGAPVPGVVIYAHHTDHQGLYSRGTAESIWSRRHGLLRGWARTDDLGRYYFRTIKPAPYPDGTMPAHVHLFVVEPGHPPYYIDDVVFAGGYGVDDAYRAKCENRGGSGIVEIWRDTAGVLHAQRDIMLEEHA